jgi:hypothetical protein
MEFVAVELDGESVRLPERVDLVGAGLALDEGIEEGGRNVAGGPQERLKVRSSPLFCVLAS